MKSLRTLILALTIVVLSGTAALANNSLVASQAAALEGSWGLAVTVDGSPNKADVRNYCNGGVSNCPNDETTYRFSFLIDMNNTAMDDFSIVRIATVRSRSGGPMGLSNRNEAFVHVRYRDGQASPYKIRMACRRDDNTWAQLGGHSLPPSGVRRVTVEWQAASAPGANDGICRIYVNTSAQSLILRAEDTGIDNDTRAIGEIWMGVDRVPANMVGTFYYDSFESFRTLAP